MKERKGIILAGGSGSRLYPSTISISKQIIPVYDKPMIYYPLSTLMLAGIQEILVISTPQDIDSFKKLLKDGSQFGIKIYYEIQESPKGIADAFVIGRNFLNGHPSCLILGDNIFHGANLSKLLIAANKNIKQSTVFSYHVADPERFGVIETDINENIIAITEKPSNPASNYAITGLYFYDENVVDYADNLIPSSRGELEITDINNMYIKNGNLTAIKLSKGYSWLDTGTPESLLDASNLIYTIEKRQGSKICCPEEIAIDRGWITREFMHSQIKNNNAYNTYLKTL